MTKKEKSKIKNKDQKENPFAQEVNTEENSEEEEKKRKISGRSTANKMQKPGRRTGK